MHPQPHRRLRLAILGASPCQWCAANCCKQNGHDYAVLLEADERRKFAPFSMDVPIRSADGSVRIERVLPYTDGRCRFLDDDDRCRIYEDRPRNCRRFECIPGYHHGGADLSGHSLFLQRNANVLKLLDEL